MSGDDSNNTSHVSHLYLGCRLLALVSQIVPPRIKHKSPLNTNVVSRVFRAARDWSYPPSTDEDSVVAAFFVLVWLKLPVFFIKCPRRYLTGLNESKLALFEDDYEVRVKVL